MPAVSRGEEAQDRYLAFLFDGRFDEHRAQAAIGFDQGDSARDARRRRLVPTGLLRRRVEHREPHPVLAQQLAAELVRILSPGMRHLVDKAFPEEAVLRMVD